MSNHKFLSAIFLGSALVLIITSLVATSSFLTPSSQLANNHTENIGDSDQLLSQAQNSAGDVLPAATGNRKVQIIMLKWKAGTGGTAFIPTSQADAATRFTPVRDYIRGQSYGRLTIDNVEYYGWLQTSIPYDNCSTTAWGNYGISNPIDNWIAQNIPNLPSDHVVRIVVMNTPCDGFPRYLTNDRRIRVGSGAFTTANLEMALGNALSSGRAAFMQCPTATGVVGPTCGSVYFGGNMWEPMGNAPQTFTGHNTSFSMWHKKKMGWVLPTEVRYVKTDTGPIVIQNNRTASGTLKMVDICIDGGRTYSIENRIKAGADLGVIDDNAFVGGIVWLTEKTDNDSIWPSEANYPPVDIYRMGYGWAPGSVLNDTTNKIKIIFGAKDPVTKALTVTVDYTGTLPVTCPAEFSPPSPTPTRSRTPTRTPTPGAELIRNGGFETDANVDLKPDNWTAHANFNRATNTFRSGVASGKHGPGTNLSYSIDNLVTGIIPQRSYLFNGYIKIPSVTSTYIFEIKIVWRNLANTELSTYSINTTSSQTLTNWTLKSRTVTAPLNATNALIRMTTSSLDNELYVDDFSLRLQ